MSVLLVVLMIATLFTGCTKEDKELVDAFIKSQEILSLESTSNMTFNLNAEGLDDKEQVIFDEIANQINNMKLSISQKSVANKDQTVAKGQIDAKIQLADMSFDSSIWVDVDMSGDKLVLKEVFKLPSMLMNLIPGAAGKEYMVLDFDTMSESIANIEGDMAQPVDFNETMAIAMKYQEKFKDAFVGYIKKYDSDLSVVTKLDTKIVNGENIKYYQVAFNNDTFKEFLKYTTISILKDENIIPLFQEYMTEIMKISGQEMPKELSKTGNIGEMVQKAQEFFEKIEELKILGEDGILITYGINEDGYLVSEEGKMDFLIDTKQVVNLVPDLMGDKELLKEMPTPVFNLSISYDSKIKNINEDLEITMPTTTEENSIDYIELIEMMVPDVEQISDFEQISEGQQEQGLMVIVEGELVEFVNQPILVDNHYLVSTRDMANAFGATTNWDSKTKEITIVKDQYETTFYKPIIREGVSYIPLRSVATGLGYTLEWEQEFQVMYIYK